MNSFNQWVITDVITNKQILNICIANTHFGIMFGDMSLNDYASALSELHTYEHPYIAKQNNQTILFLSQDVDFKDNVTLVGMKVASLEFVEAVARHMKRSEGTNQ